MTNIYIKKKIITVYVQELWHIQALKIVSLKRKLSGMK
jgi:hypothetical protein